VIIDAEDSQEEKKEAWGRPDAFRRRWINQILRR
jgi:hypothetical protein